MSGPSLYAPGTAPQWGRMDAAQMLAHCAEVQEVANGKKLENTPLLVKLFKSKIRKIVVSDKPYRKSRRTHPQYIQNDPRDFDTEKQRLVKGLDHHLSQFGV